MSLDPQAFEEGLAAWVESPQVKEAWREYGAPDIWEWGWELRRPEAASLRHKRYACLVLTRFHAPSLPSVGKKGEEEEENVTATEAQAVKVEEEEDPCTLPQNTTTQTHTAIDWTFHILYSEIYATPTLWFRAVRADGVPLTGDEIGALLMGVRVSDGGAAAGEEGVGAGVGMRVEGEQQERWTVLSQDEHPLLGFSYYFLHPCGTPARMAHLMSVERDGAGEEEERQRGLVYLVKWFGLVVAPLLGLPYPMQFCQRVINA